MEMSFGESLEPLEDANSSESKGEIDDCKVQQSTQRSVFSNQRNIFEAFGLQNPNKENNPPKPQPQVRKSSDSKDTFVNPTMASDD